MKGKIFSESSNIYQDQAKILFDFYQSVAEKVVTEEERIEKEISKLEEEKTMLQNTLSSFWNRIKLWFQGNMKKTKAKITSLLSRIAEFERMHKEIFRDYKVSKLGVAYIPIADQVKYENKSFIVDHTGIVSDSEVKLQLSKQNDLLIETINDLEKLSQDAPIVETSKDIEQIATEHYSKSMQQLSQHDYFGKLERSLRTVSFCMDDLDITSVQLPLVENESSYFDFLKEYSTNEVAENVPIFSAFDTKKYDEQISKFQELNKLRDSLSGHTSAFEDVLKNLMVTMASSVQAISSLKVASTDKIIFESNKVLFKILKSPYNHYSSTLEATEIERIRNENFNYSESVSDYVPFELKDSSKMKFNIASGMWTAEDGSTSNFPFGIHQIHEEIIAPMVQNLMNETRIERMKIYNHIKDQKIDYLNKWHQDTEDFYGRNRAEAADLINLMRGSLREYIAAYNTLASLKKTEDSMSESGGSLDSTIVETTEETAEVFAAFELQSKEFQNVQVDFEEYMERLKEDIDRKAEKFEHIDYYDAMLRDGTSKEIATAASEVHGLDPRRKPLISVNPLFAKTSDILPMPSVEDIVSEHFSLDLPSIARNALIELEGEDFDQNDLMELSSDNDEETVVNSEVFSEPEAQQTEYDTGPIEEQEIINDELLDNKTNPEDEEDVTRPENIAEPEAQQTESDTQPNDAQEISNDESIEQMSEDDANEILEICRNSGKLAAIKVMKERTGWSLAECKQWIDKKL